jgi:hypothetical protein
VNRDAVAKTETIDARADTRISSNFIQESEKSKERKKKLKEKKTKKKAPYQAAAIAATIPHPAAFY